MIVQINTDKNIDGDERLQNYFSTQIEEDLEYYKSLITRVEVHLSDENGKKDGINDIQCLLEARLEAKQPIAVTNRADTVELAVSGALDKLKNSLETIVGRLQNRS